MCHFFGVNLFIFGMVVYFDNIKVKFECQGHLVKFKVTSTYQIFCLLDGKIYIKFMILIYPQGHGHFRSRSF